ncbi:hypothetical protein BRC82_06705 [Halobacteriales archaeon QS_1_67_19]|nr:MAG: hypothetical protein BRC82_06705 [Halobacteriales archaeon QS_1_67_19]
MTPRPGRREHGPTDRDRGQLILVTGLAIAVMLVALVLLLNTVIYTQNLATRGADVDDRAAVEFQQAVVEGVGEVIDAENRAEYGNSAKVEANVTDGIDRYDALASRYHTEQSTVAYVDRETVSLSDGALLRQTDASRDFTNAGGGAGDWTLVEGAGAGNAPGVRDATITVSREDLSDSAGSGFALQLSGDADNDWRVRLYDDGGAVTVAVKNGSESLETGVCSAAGPEATVDLTAGTLNGSACPQLAWATGVSAPYDVEFVNGAEATGTYALTVHNGSATTDVRTDNFESPDAGASPRAAAAVYAAEFAVHFRTPDLTYRTTVRVAPGEPA